MALRPSIKMNYDMDRIIEKFNKWSKIWCTTDDGR